MICLFYNSRITTRYIYLSYSTYTYVLCMYDITLLIKKSILIIRNHSREFPKFLTKAKSTITTFYHLGFPQISQLLNILEDSNSKQCV